MKSQKYRRKERFCQASFLAVALGLASVVTQAADLIPADSSVYYQLNGGSSLSLPPMSSSTALTVGGNAGIDLGLDCHGFNPSVSITNSINQLVKGAKNLPQAIETNATAALGALPMYELAKNDPNLYNLLQNAMSSAQMQFKLSQKSCDQAMSDIRRGNNPYQNWAKISLANDWSDEVKSVSIGSDGLPNEKLDINAAQSDVLKKRGQSGVDWIHGNRSGGMLGQQVPIHVISDVALAGYNIILGGSRSLDDTSNAPADSALANYWKDGKSASGFAERVLGDLSLSSDKSQQKTVAGSGLVSLLTTCPSVATADKTCFSTVRDHLQTLVASDSAPTANDLESVSAHGLAVTSDVIERLKSMDTTPRALFVQRLAEDIAITNLVDEAFMLRRILLAGRQAQVVQNLPPAVETVDHAVSTLNRDINNLLFEHRIRQQLASHTLQTLINLSQQEREKIALSQSHTIGQPPLEHGAVYSEAAS